MCSWPVYSRIVSVVVVVVQKFTWHAGKEGSFPTFIFTHLLTALPQTRLAPGLPKSALQILATRATTSKHALANPLVGHCFGRGSKTSDVGECRGTPVRWTLQQMVRNRRTRFEPSTEPPSSASGLLEARVSKSLGVMQSQTRSLGLTARTYASTTARRLETVGREITRCGRLSREVLATFVILVPWRHVLGLKRG